jgi:hypothetical protein
MDKFETCVFDNNYNLLLIGFKGVHNVLTETYENGVRFKYRT